jgi:hypothetical protein
VQTVTVQYVQSRQKPLNLRSHVRINRQGLSTGFLLSVSVFSFWFVSLLILSFLILSDSLSCADLAAQLDAFKDNPPSDNDSHELALNIRKLRKSLTDATSSLPAYDQRQCQAVRPRAAHTNSENELTPPYSKWST